MARALLWCATLAAATAVHSANGAFFVCPASCEALVLPRDMESIDDCQCPGQALRSHRDEEEEDEDEDFRGCTGRYVPREGLTSPQSVADCDCYPPYTKDSATGVCHLSECPRAGNYVVKPFRHGRGSVGVASLADCDCLAPFVKDARSGECVAAATYECPAHASPVPGRRPLSFVDCHCDFGYVRAFNGADQCKREAPSYACPPHSTRSPVLAPGARPRGFFDCECEAGGEFTRNERLQSCDPVRGRDEEQDDREEDADDEFECPPYSRPLAPSPRSVAQCECLPGFAWMQNEPVCARTSAYSCPSHAFPRRGLPTGAPASFADCHCAHGFSRDPQAEKCLAWFLSNGNTCPPYAFLVRWPLQSKSNCECFHGFANSTSSGKKQCRETPVGDDDAAVFSQCPPHSVAVDWPVATADDCGCLFGFERTELTEKQRARSDGEGFRCAVDADLSLDEHAAACKAPLVMNPLTGGCHYPVEDVRPPASFSQHQPQDEANRVLFNGVEYDYVVADDDVLVVQGDVAIGQRLSWGEGDHHVLLHGYYNSERDHRWPDANMCYQVAESARPFDRVVRDAMSHITHVTGFKFTQCTGNDCITDSGCLGDFIDVKATGSSCYSYIGRIGGSQPLGVSADCGLGNIMHVLLHAVGLRHAIDRPDRDAHVRVAWECIPESKRSFFVIEDAGNVSSQTTAEPYDLYSIMHHPATAFVHDAAERKPAWCASVVPRIADPVERHKVLGMMGQRALLTGSDVHSVWRLYPSLQHHHETHGVAMPQAITPATVSHDGLPIGLVVDMSKVHESKLHAAHDTVAIDTAAVQPATAASTKGSSVVRRVSSFLGAVATLCAFGAFLAFVVSEARKRAVSGSDSPYYSELLLTDKAGLND